MPCLRIGTFAALTLGLKFCTGVHLEKRYYKENG